MNHVIIGTAGHVDHGKTCLIKALTGVDTDRLAEEKKRGITIELGFASLDLGDGVTAGIVDVPGHERFIRNMLAGAGGIDIAMLVVAADEGVMPQTREHLSILKLLNIPAGVVVITKCDLADGEWISLVEEETAEAVKGTFLEGADVVRVSAFTGEGLDELKSILKRLALSAGGKDLSRPFRLPADRVFSLEGFGTVITGTLIEGTLKEGDAITLYPSGLTTRARSVQVHSRNVPEACGGQRVAVNLAGIRREDISRGEVAAAPGSLSSSMMLDVFLTCLPESSRAIKNNSRLHLYHGAREILCKAVLMEKDELSPGESGYAQLRLEEPAAAKRGDRFVVRFYSPLETVGGGEIVDPCPLKRRRRDRNALEGMRVKREGNPGQIVAQLIAERSPAWPPLSLIAVCASLPAEEVRAEAEKLRESGQAVRVDRDTYLHIDYVRKVRREMTDILSAFHKDNPLREGMRREELRTRLLPGIPLNQVDGLLDEFLSSGTIKENRGLISLRSFKAEAGEEAKRRADEIMSIYRRAGYSPPATSELGSDRLTQQVLESLFASRALVRLDASIAIDASLYDKALAAALEMIDEGGSVTLGAFRDRLGTSRKYAVALLEHFDRSRLTKKVGDARVRA